MLPPSAAGRAAAETASCLPQRAIPRKLAVAFTPQSGRHPAEVAKAPCERHSSGNLKKEILRLFRGMAALTELHDRTCDSANMGSIPKHGCRTSGSGQSRRCSARNDSSDERIVRRAASLVML